MRTKLGKLMIYMNQPPKKNNPRIAYFGGEPIGVPVLEELKACGITPSLVVCNPDRPSGRGRTLTRPPVKQWAAAHGIEVFQPDTLKEADIPRLTAVEWDLFVVVAYNKIMPDWLIQLPTHKTINVHPSLLPKLRGMSPIRTAILEDKRAEIGVSIMLMDAEMDHGPLLAQTALPITDDHWPIDGRELDTALANLGGALLADTIGKWLAGDIIPTDQNHVDATYTKKLTKEQGELTLDPHSLPTGPEAYAALLKIRGLAGWPGTFFFHNNKRIKITNAELTATGDLRVMSVIPEGKSEIPFTTYIAASE